jgi:hypothetical protein
MHGWITLATEAAHHKEQETIMDNSKDAGGKDLGGWIIWSNFWQDTSAGHHLPAVIYAFFSGEKNHQVYFLDRTLHV